MLKIMSISCTVKKVMAKVILVFYAIDIQTES